MGKTDGIVVGVGGVVLREGRVLLVQHNYGPLNGRWLLPGGHVGRGENLDAAVMREVREETGIEAVPQGVVAVRSLLQEEGNLEIYIVFLMRYVRGEPVPFPAENQAVGFFTLEEVAANPLLTPLARAIIEKVMRGSCTLLPWRQEFSLDSESYRLFG